MVARAPIALTPYLLVVRVILFLVFVPAGIQSLAMVDFTGEEAESIRRLRTPPASAPTPVDSTATPSSLTAQEDSGTYQAQALYRGALQLENAGCSSPVLLAWIATLIQLIGGGLMLPGLFCRVFGFAIAVVVGMTFILDSWPLLAESPWPILKLESGQFDQITSQLALFALALGMLVCSGGNFSLDRLIFGSSHRSRSGHVHETEDIEEE